MPPPKDCPCHSGRRYAACCRPLHEHARAAATPEELMRSRYAAFALGLGAYIEETLARSHPPQNVVRGRERYLDLCILHTSVEGDRGEVLFYAKIFEKGADRSFCELSSFVREDGAWKYESGLFVPGARLPPDPKSLTLESFLELAGG